MIRNRTGTQRRTAGRNDGPRGLRPYVLTLPCLSLLAVALISGGCASGSPPEKQQYILEAVRQGPPVPRPLDGSLLVNRFHVDTAFATKSLLYRLGEFKYESDFYRQFLISPGVMLTEQTRDWLADSGLFARVVARGSQITPDYTLEANVTALYGDFSDESAPTAVVEIRFFLVGEARHRERVVFTETYRTATPVPSREAEVFVGTLTQGFAEILGRLEADLAKVLAAEANTADRRPRP